jgi:hypothetical protein
MFILKTGSEKLKYVKALSCPWLHSRLFGRNVIGTHVFLTPNAMLETTLNT